jgi:hypothetical protein
MQVHKTLAVAAIAIAAASLHADDRFERTFSRTLTFRGGRVTVDHKFGSLKLRAVPGSEVSVRGTIRASDADYGRQIQIVVAEVAGGIEVRTNYPERHMRIFNGSSSQSVELEVTVPENAPVTLHNRFGSIDVTGVKVASEIVGGQASVAVRNTRGAQRIENSFGSVEVDDAEGDVTITNANGSVRASHVRGSLNVSDRFGSIVASDVGGDAQVHGGNGSIEVTSVRGKAIVRNSFGSSRMRDVGRDLTFTGNNSRVEATNIGGAATITTTFDSVIVGEVTGPVRISDSNGNVTVTDAKSDVTIDNRFGSVRAERVRGSADVDNGNASVTLTDIGGSVRVHNTFASVFVKNAGGAITVSNQNGAVSVSGLRIPCHPITLDTSFSSIRLALPAGAGYDVTARTSFGHITTDIPITTTNVGEDILNGRIGNGGCKLDLRTTNGGITIGRE